MINPITAIAKTLRRVSGSESRALTRQLRKTQRLAYGAIQAARSGNGGWAGISSNHDEDAANREHSQSLAEVLQRSQDLDINNPDIRGFNRARTAQIVGAHVRFKSSPRASEIGLDQERTLEIAEQIDRVRHLHSRSGGFDSSGKNRTEGTQQSRAVLTALVHGRCLIHRVWRPENPILPLALELIPGVRISTPYNRQGDPLVSYGVEYTDEHRTRVVAYHVRRVSKTVGDSYVPDVVWDRLPVADCSILELPDVAGLDSPMPLSVACTRMARNRGEMIESAVESARAQARIYAHVETAAGADPWGVAADDAAEDDDEGVDSSGHTAGFGVVSSGAVAAIYGAAGEKINWCSAKLPDPDFVGFNDVVDERMSRGLSSSKSRFTRRVNNSWAGGRLEDQQDDPIIDTYRECFKAAWQPVNAWLLEAIWLTDAVKLPGYSVATRAYWSEYRSEFPGKLHINPQDTMAARERAMQLRTTTPQQACEEDGRDFREQMKGWAEAMAIIAQAEKDAKLEPGTLSILFSAKTMSSASGDTIAEPIPMAEPKPAAGGQPAAGYRSSHHNTRRVAAAGGGDPPR